MNKSNRELIEEVLYGDGGVPVSASEVVKLVRSRDAILLTRERIESVLIELKELERLRGVK